MGHYKAAESKRPSEQTNERETCRAITRGSKGSHLKPSRRKVAADAVQGRIALDEVVPGRGRWLMRGHLRLHEDLWSEVSEVYITAHEIVDGMT